MNKNSFRNDEGIALLVATIFVAIAILMLSAVVARVIQQNNQTTQYKMYNDALTGVESAVSKSWYELEHHGDGMVGMGTWNPPVGVVGLVLPTFSDTGVAPETSPSQPNVQYMTYAFNWGTNNIDDDGDGLVDEDDEVLTYTLYGMGSDRGVTRTAEVVMKGHDVNVWRNAIFAGDGQGGGLINGNVSIHGSVHLLGANVVSGGTVLSALDLSGTSLIHNNYVGLDPGIAARIPALPTRIFNGETIRTLNATLRVQHGLVGMSGTSEIGQPDVVGNTIKETMDGVFVNDGYTGDSVVDDGDRGDPKQLYSDNGWDEEYDLGEKVPMPFFIDDYVDKDTGLTYIDPATGVNYTHEDYFEQVLTGTPYVGDMTISTSTDFYYNATRPTESDPSLRLPTDDYILYRAATNSLIVNGQIQVNGNLKLTWTQGNNRTMNYTGRAAILVHGDVTLDNNLVTRNADGTTANSFPRNNFLGIMAEDNLYVGMQSQLTLMGAYYAQDTVKSTKQTTTIGTLVGSFFDMGTNVPNIYQVPDLPANLPLGMIGAYPILVFTKVSWRELGA